MEVVASGCGEKLRLELQNELANRCRKNPQYSLRAFARSLDMDPSLLSKVLNNKRPLGKKQIEKVIERLDWGPDKVVDVLDTNAGYWEEKRQSLLVEADKFHVIADWYHYALFELLNTEFKAGDEQTFAKMLGISVSEVKIALERLNRMGFIEFQDGKGWIRKTEYISIEGHKFSTSAFRKLQKQVLEKAQVALSDTPFEERLQYSLTVAANSSVLAKVRERFVKFRKEIDQLCSVSKNKNEVFNLSLSFYPTLKKTKGEQ